MEFRKHLVYKCRNCGNRFLRPSVSSWSGLHSALAEAVQGTHVLATHECGTWYGRPMFGVGDLIGAHEDPVVPQ